LSPGELPGKPLKIPRLATVAFSGGGVFDPKANLTLRRTSFCSLRPSAQF
jgi:hypothetical protein